MTRGGILLIIMLGVSHVRALHEAAAPFIISLRATNLAYSISVGVVDP